MLNYDKWHSDSKLQNKIIKETNFTYKYLINVANKYCDKNTKILDVGCGVGTIDFYLGKCSKSVLGIDMSAESIKVANLNKKIFEIRNINFKKLDFPNEVPKGNYHLIICSEVLEHLQKDNKALKALHNLLEKEGSLIMSVPSIEAPLFKLGLLNNFDRRVGHLRRYKKESLSKMLKNMGFIISLLEETEGIFRNFLYTSRIGNIPLRLANKFAFISYIFTMFDNILGKIIGYSNIYIVAKK